MGSEGHKSVRINVTGFKKFLGVAENPTETIVKNLKNYVEARGLPAGVTLGVCAALETAGEGAMPELYRILESGIAKGNSLNEENIFWLHLGVNAGASKFAIECQAVNEANFCCPDELGWQPEQVPIVPSDGGISQARKTTCSVEKISKFLKEKGYDALISNDAGLFVCNFVYYQSLWFTAQRGHNSLFIHTPSFHTIDEETQMDFIATVLEAIASSC